MLVQFVLSYILPAGRQLANVGLFLENKYFELHFTFAESESNLPMQKKVALCSTAHKLTACTPRKTLQQFRSTATLSGDSRGNSFRADVQVFFTSHGPSLRTDCYALGRMTSIYRKRCLDIESR